MNLESFYSSYANDVYRYLYSLCGQSFLAEDLLQDTFYKAFLHLEDNDIDNLKTWLFKVAYYTFIDYQRKNKRIILYEKIGEYLSPDHETPETKYIQSEQCLEILNLMSKLSSEERQAILLCDFHDLKLQEASEILSLNLNTLKTHLYRGRNKLKAML